MRGFSRRQFVATALGAAGAVATRRLSAAPSPATGAAAGGRNVLLIVSDDRNRRIGCYGDPLVRTPNIDRLAARGVRFDRAYCQVPLCNPSRTSFLSGRRPDATGVWNNFTLPRDHLGEAVFLPEYFRGKGYYTARVGKILHDVVSRGIDPVLMRTFDDPKLWDSAENELVEANRHNSEQRTVRHENYPWHSDPQEWGIVTGSDLAIGDAVIGRRIAAMIEAPRERPFFIAAGFRRPHVPMVAPQRFFDLYPTNRIDLPYAPADDRDDIPPIALTFTPGDEKLTPDDNRRITAAYHASTSFMDAQLGVILDAMDRSDRWKDTIVVFISDHGYHLGEHLGLWRKRTLFQEAARVPLIVAAPGVRSAVCPRLVESVDLYPTLLDLSGLPAGPGLEGTSFAPLLGNPDRPWKRAAFTSVQHNPPRTTGRSVQTERYRYSEWGGEQVAELYDLEADPHEFTNLARDPGHAAVVRELHDTLDAGWTAAKPPAGAAERA